MSDSISRDKAIEVVNKIACGSFDGDLSHIASEIEDALLEIPSAEKTGRWIYQDDRREVTGNDWYCSECGNGVRYQDHYCPNCGAKMEVEHG